MHLRAVSLILYDPSASSVQTENLVDIALQKDTVAKPPSNTVDTFQPAHGLRGPAAQRVVVSALLVQYLSSSAFMSSQRVTDIKKEVLCFKNIENVHSYKH